MTRRISLASVSILFLAGMACAPESGSMGEEQFGNKPLNALNYTNWPGAIDVVNDEHRVYYQWVNGNELFCFEGDMDALNAALQNLAEITVDKLDLILLPAPQVAHTFTRGQTVRYDWMLNLKGGIASHLATRDQGGNIWVTHPVLTVPVTDEMDLESLVIPENISVLHTFDLKERYLKCLTSSDQTVRGWCCSELAGLGKYDEEIMDRIAALLEDEDNWVRLNAMSALATYGNKARKHIDQIKANMDSENKRLKERAKSTLARVESSKVRPDAETAHDELLEKIRMFCKYR